MLRLLPLTLLLLLLAAGSARAATVSVPVPAEGQVAVAVAAVGKHAAPKVRVPAGVAVTGAARKGRLAIAVVRRRGVAAAGAVRVKVAGRVKGLRRFGAALAGGAAPGSACKGLAGLLSRPLQLAGLGAGELRAVGAAAAARLCGRPLPAGAPALLERLGLGAAPAGGGAISTPGTSRPLPSTGGGSAPGNECANGVDDDGDGQVDAPSERRPRPDPGCMNANDPTEAGEVALPAGCNAGAGVGADRSVLQVGINDGCGSFVEIAVYAAPKAFACDVAASAGTWVCVIAHGHAFAEPRTATAADLADLAIQLDGAADCSVPATIVLTRPTLEVAELVTPIARCGEAAPACSNGADDDGDGLADARDAAGAADPDPGCSSPADASEDSEVDPPAGCSIVATTFNDDELFPGIVVEGCGAIAGAWFKPSAAPTDCLFALGGAGAQACSVTGATVGATFAATTDRLLLGTHTATLPQCAPVTAALALADGRVAAARGDWC